MTREYGKGYDEGYADGLKDAPQRKPLTLHELSKIFASIPSIPFDGEWQLELVRAVEAAHNIKE